MLIPDELAQRIVDTAQGLIHRNVNIMNREGIIIGTAQVQRRGTFHKGARDVIALGRAVEINEGQTGLYPGSRPGVNLPLVLDDRIIGVIGVTGDPEEVRGTARLIKMITELFLERELLQNLALQRLKNTESLVELLLGRNVGENLGRLRRAAKPLGFDLELPRCVAVADISGLLSGFVERYGSSELIQERSAEAVLQHLNGAALLSDQDAAVILNGRLLCLKALGPGDPTTASLDWLRELAASLVKWTGSRVPGGIGALGERLEDYAHSYGQAEYCLQRAGGSRPCRSIYERELAVGYVLREAVSGPAALVLRPLFQSLDATIRRKPALAETARTLLAHGQDSEAAAEALGVHRNTLAYRLARFREATGLDPLRRPDDALALRLAFAREAAGNG
ncbi:MAG TPA: sugar diacid recognition domain-containing protein [Desulfovibrio sp.]|uniref:CdaR family transcriptional regulator n=1 Tax=Desulfovibrio sp. TaxID=885 RepID=UPI002B7D82B6|nr:sugar diacid recognition domain-containing protein [Desulfovibrio sp.]HMM37712.1 sugar diacid recognition domain-containing protein [Desulfovibrio sp.]